MAKSYLEKLRDPRWQKRRLEIMASDCFACRLCQSDIKTLNVHHRGYVKGLDPWDYHEDQLVTLCEDCHKLQHEDDDILQNVLSRMPLTQEHYISRKDIALLICGIFALDSDGYVDTDWENKFVDIGFNVDRQILGYWKNES